MTSRPPSGRGELLAWINQCCGLQYPSVEALRDGAAYCLVLEAALQRAATQSKSSGGASTSILEQRANLASKLLQRVDWEAMSLTTTQSAAKDLADPSLDSIQLRDACERNFQVLQDVLHRCVPKDHTLEIDSKRLAIGKLQEHVRLLQWMHAFSVKMAKAFPADATKVEAKSPAAAAAAAPGPRPGRSRSAGPSVGRKPTPSSRETDTPAAAEYAPERYVASTLSPERPLAAARGGEEQGLDVNAALQHLVVRVEAIEADAARGITEESRESDADVTIGDLKNLLEERDVLWQTLSMLEQLVEADKERLARSVAAGREERAAPLLAEVAGMFGMTLFSS
jgi:hypothetical protein